MLNKVANLSKSASIAFMVLVVCSLNLVTQCDAETLKPESELLKDRGPFTHDAGPFIHD